MRHLHIVWIFALLLLAPLVYADIDNFFSVKSNDGPYDVAPGEEIIVNFTLSNRDLLSPETVRAYIDPCPYGWDCESRLLSFDETGVYPVNLTVKISDTAIPKRYSLAILLESEEWTKRGDDRFLVDVLSEAQLNTITYEEYLEKKRAIDEGDEPEPEPTVEIFPGPDTHQELPEEEVVEEIEEEPVVEPEVKGDGVFIPGLNHSRIIEDVERLESSHQFVEYASVVLLAVLAFVLAGAYVSFKNMKEEKKK